jgi:diaminohydroxyphosphoribosylaminopyrimidine deaminase/5-amino-6-(5-phosphoribosylamino)uracil reductase
MQEQIDQVYMRQALELAKLGGRAVAPNPLVGAVIVNNKEVIGTGYHQQLGQPHAEVNCFTAQRCT